MKEIEQTDTANEGLWVLAKAKDNAYAIDSTRVQAILQLEQELIPVAHSAKELLGMVTFRGAALPILDLRALLGMDSRLEEEREFENMLQQRKEDHVRWVNELERCLREEDTFQLTTDPHKCAFGKWYDSYEPSSYTVEFHLKKIEEPHQKLHHAAIEAFACSHENGEGNAEEQLSQVIDKGVKVYMGQVVALLEQAKQIFRESYRRMIMVVSGGTRSYGLLVDEVLSVEKLTEIDGIDQKNAMCKNQWVKDVAMRNDDHELVLVLDLAGIEHINLDCNIAK